MLGHGVGAPLVPPQCVRCRVPPSPVSTGCILSPRDTTQARANAALSCVELLPLYSNRQTGTKRLAKPSKVGVIERMRGSSICAARTPRSPAHQRRGCSAAADYRSGAPTNELTMKWHVHRHAIAALLHRAGIEPRTRRLAPGQVVHVSSLYRAGWSLAQLREELSISPNTVRRYLRMAGVVMRSPMNGRS